jgi:hypothetical protein
VNEAPLRKSVFERIRIGFQRARAAAGAPRHWPRRYRRAEHEFPRLE